jgi:hypothetical protein
MEAGKVGWIMKRAALLSPLALLLLLGVEVVVDAQQPSRTLLVLDAVFDPAYKGSTYPVLGGPFLIQVSDSFFRETASYPRGETMAQGTFLFVDIEIFNNSDRPLQIPVFTLQDSRGRIYLTAIRARRSRKAILAGESLNPGVSKDGYLIFDVPSISSFDSLPMRYKLLIANSRQTIDVNVFKKEE